MPPCLVRSAACPSDRDGTAEGREVEGRRELEEGREVEDGREMDEGRDVEGWRDVEGGREMVEGRVVEGGREMEEGSRQVKHCYSDVYCKKVQCDRG